MIRVATINKWLKVIGFLWISIHLTNCASTNSTIDSVVRDGVIAPSQIATPATKAGDTIPQNYIFDTIPFRIDSAGRILIDVTVNGTGPHAFMIDTAATKTLLFENLRQSLDLKFTQNETTFVYGAILRRERPALIIDKVTIGNLALNDIKSFSLPNLITVGDAQPVDGILGLDFLSRYAVYINIQENEISFMKSGYRPKRREYVFVPIKYKTLGNLAQGLPFVPATIERRPVEALLDLGAAVTVANWAAAKNSFKIDITKYFKDEYVYQGAFGDIPLRARANSVNIAIGKRLWEKQSMEISNLGIFKTMGLEETPTLVINAKLMRDDNFIMDFPAKKLFLKADRAKRIKRSPIQNRNCIATKNNSFLCDTLE